MTKLPNYVEKAKAKSVYASGLACKCIMQMDYEDLRFTLSLLMEQMYKKRIGEKQ